MTSRAVLLVFIVALPTTVLAQETSSNAALQSSQSAVIQTEPQGRETLRISRHFGAEAEPLPAGSAFARGLQRERDLELGGAAYGVAYLPLTPKADIFARAGYGAAELSENPGRPFEDGWKFGIGARYSPNANKGVRADFTRHDFRTSRIKANILSFGYARRF